jgi:isoaspartyl peptidase/L-asparaginase-like protein (Ntn-hydrolase superfamily)
MTIVVVHGGVSGIAQQRAPALSIALTRAPTLSTALDAVETATTALEDDPDLNAGFGAVLNLAGELELDAGIAEGASGRCGGVANVGVRHPVAVARRVLEETPHTLLTGAGAAAFAGDAEVLPDTTPEQRARWEDARASGRLGHEGYGAPHDVDTVGAVALGERGDLAAASSTGGVFGKMPGRVGDTPIFGAGLFASARAAVVGTGVGEVFLESLACFVAGRLIANGHTPQQACEDVIAELPARAGLSAGLLALDERGRIGAAFRGGSWRVHGPDGPIEAAHLG